MALKLSAGAGRYLFIYIAWTIFLVTWGVIRSVFAYFNYCFNALYMLQHKIKIPCVIQKKKIKKSFLVASSPVFPAFFDFRAAEKIRDDWGRGTFLVNGHYSGHPYIKG